MYLSYLWVIDEGSWFMNIELPLDRKQRSKVRPLSKALFHSEYALEAYIEIALKSRFYKSQIATAAGCQPNFAGSFLKRLEDERLIERVPTEEGQRRHYFRKVDSPIWMALLNLSDALLSEGPSATVAQLPRRP